MTTSTAYTSLEALLFFQSLSTVGVEPSSFSKISDLLKENEFIRGAKTFDAGRLSPDSLRELYLKLVKEEIRNDGEYASSEGRRAPGDGEPQNPRKRKLSTPPLASISDAARYLHLLPQLITRLYARYRQHAVQEIREEERRYDSLQRDIEEIQSGKWDERLERRHDSVRNEIESSRPEHAKLPSLLNDSPTISNRTSHKPLHGQDNMKEPQTSSHDHHRASVDLGASLSAVQSNQLSGTASPSFRHAEPPRYPHSVQPSTNTFHAKGDMYNTPQNIPRPPSQSQYGPTDAGMSFLPPPHQSAHGYRLGSSSSDSHRPLAPPPSRYEIGTGPSPSPELMHSSAGAGHTSTSPVILPPPPGMHRTPGLSNGPLDALADMAGQQYRTQSPSQPLRNNQLSPSQPPQSQLSQPRPYFQSPYQYPPRQPGYTGPYQTHTPQPMPSPYPSNSGHPSLSPFQSLSPVQTQSFGQPHRHQSAHEAQRSLLPPYSRGTGAAMPNIYPSPYAPVQIHTPSGQQTPLSAPAGRRQPYGLSPLDIPGSSTKWKKTKDSRLMKSPGSPTPPGPGDVSPISDRAQSPVQALPAEGKLQPSRKDVPQREVEIPEDVDRDLEEKTVSERAKSRSRRGRGRYSTPARSGRGRGRTRAGSSTSSALAGSGPASTRSQSVISHVDELSMDTGIVKARKIKDEAPATPAGVVGDEDIDMMENTQDEGARMTTRQRRGTLKGLEVTESTGTSKKRKRGRRETPDESTPANASVASPGLTKPNYVLATRNFPRTSATIMNDVTGHKLASMFAKPLTEREAPGYKDLIYRPQDLKSIKSAISAGSRAVAAAAETIGTPAGDGGSPGQGASTPSSSRNASLWIPKTAEVVPPKGIVNSAQLEKELMRMFANAVMFNPDSRRGFGPAFKDELVNMDGTEGDDVIDDGGEEDEGGVVRDTREMFQAVEKSVSAWRNAERAAEEVGIRGAGVKLREREEDDADELAGEEAIEGKHEEGQGVVTTRRRG